MSSPRAIRGFERTSLSRRGFWGCGLCFSLDHAADAALDGVHVRVDDRGHEEREHLGKNQAADDREPQRLPGFRPRAETHRDRERTEQGGNKDEAEAKPWMHGPDDYYKNAAIAPNAAS